MTQLHALALTLLLEGLVAAGLLRWWGQRGWAWGRTVAIVLAASLLTHPLAWQANRSWLRGLPFPVRAAIIEVTVVLVEAVIVWRASQLVAAGRLSLGRALVLALLANAASFGYGLWLRA